MTEKCLTVEKALEIADSGDCLLWKGGSLISRLIRLWTSYSHASLIVRLEDCGGKLYLVEAVASGVEFRDAERRILESRDEVFLFRPKWIMPTMRRCLVKQAMDATSLEIGYDFKGLFANAVGRVSTDAKRYFCSEFVWDTWTRCGIAPDWSVTAPRPGDIPNRIAGYLYRIERKKDG